MPAQLELEKRLIERLPMQFFAVDERPIDVEKQCLQLPHDATDCPKSHAECCRRN